MASRTAQPSRNLVTKQAILEATEQIMREEGYAAVSSRKIAAKAGLKSQLVHYHFKTMDDLFLALFRNVDEQFFKMLAQAVTSKRPLSAIWDLCKNVSGPRLTKEFVAMATHHERLRYEIARSAERTRSVLTAQLARTMADNAISEQAWPPVVISILMSGAARLILDDVTLGATAGHQETVDFVDAFLMRLEPGQRTDA